MQTSTHHTHEDLANDLRRVETKVDTIYSLLATDQFSQPGLVARVIRLEEITNSWYQKWAVVSGIGGGIIMIIEFWQFVKPLLIK